IYERNHATEPDLETAVRPWVTLAGSPVVTGRLAAGFKSRLAVGPDPARAHSRGRGRLGSTAVGRAVPAPVGQLRTGCHWLCDRRWPGADPGVYHGPVQARCPAARQHAADDPQCPPSGADPAGDPLVRHR